MIAVVISGVSRGLGSALLGLCLDQQHDVTCIGRKLPPVAKEQSRSLSFIQADLGDVGNIPNDFSLSLDDVSELVFISNAGTVEPIGQLSEVSIEQILRATNINYLSPIKIIKCLLRATADRNIPFRIINISSGAALRPVAGWGAYCSSKASVRMFLDCLSLDNENVVIRHVDPGLIDTDMQAVIRDSNESDFPLVSQFVEYKRENKLRAPLEVAREILSKEGLLCE